MRESVIALTYAGGHPNWLSAARRLASQGRQLERVQDFTIYTKGNLDADFLERNRGFIDSHTRGAGYWLWKPQILLQALSQTKSAEFLYYQDAGSEIYVTSKSQKKFETYLTHAREFGVFVFDSGHPEQFWTKEDLLKQFVVPGFRESTQCLSGTIIFDREFAFEICNLWLEKMEESNYHYLDDSKSLTSNVQGFIEHRHDQSILSLILKQRKIPFFPDSSQITLDELKVNEEPIWNVRNRSRTSLITHPDWDRSPGLLDRANNFLYSRTISGQ